MILILILSGVFLNAAAQLLLKAGMKHIGHFEFVLANVIPVAEKIMVSPPIITGIIFYGLSVLIWLLVLSRVDVSFAYPMLSIGYIINAIGAYYFFGETLSLTRLLGIGVIIIGVYLLFQS